MCCCKCISAAQPNITHTPAVSIYSAGHLRLRAALEAPGEAMALVARAPATFAARHERRQRASSCKMHAVAARAHPHDFSALRVLRRNKVRKEVDPVKARRDPGAARLLNARGVAQQRERERLEARDKGKVRRRERSAGARHRRALPRARPAPETLPYPASGSLAVSDHRSLAIVRAL